MFGEAEEFSSTVKQHCGVSLNVDDEVGGGVGWVAYLAGGWLPLHSEEISSSCSEMQQQQQ